VCGRSYGNVGTAHPWVPGRRVNWAPPRRCAGRWCWEPSKPVCPELVPWSRPEWMWPGRSSVAPEAGAVGAPQPTPVPRLRIPWAPPKVQLDRRAPCYGLYWVCESMGNDSRERRQKKKVTGIAYSYQVKPKARRSDCLPC